MRKAYIKHSDKAAEFIKDESRTDWHNQAVAHLRLKRDNGVSVVPEWEELRQLASVIKSNTLSFLDEYLIKFEQEAIENGVQVHWASDAKEHNKIVLKILMKHKASRLVKSKSMLTEECHLNNYLENNGIEVVDTDLGERIIQLRKEGPSHIVAPAIHLKKEEVSDLFHEKLNTEKNNSDPNYLTEAARISLRKKFAVADVALTGINFAIAETGGIVVCTNEGNADMGVHSVPVQIHCMGIEKVIPKQAHLGVFLRLLARSATGQPITIYSSHYQKPKPGGEMHIVILDNGRSSHLAKDDFRAALKCIRCGACINTCPVYRRSGGYTYGHTVPGPIGSVLSPGFDIEKYRELPFASSLCGACSDVCPVKIDLHEQLYKWRQVIYDENLLESKKSFGLKIAARILSKPKNYRRAVRWYRTVNKSLPFLINNAVLNPWVRNRIMPQNHGATFKEWYKKNHL